MVQPSLSRAAHDRRRATLPIPAADECRVWIDFDGTISQRDVLDEVIRRCAIDDSWQDVELAWQRGEIGSRECLSRQFDVVRASETTLNAVLETIGLDPGFIGLLQLLKNQNVPVAILSDGADAFIHRLLSQAKVNDLTVRCNAMHRNGDRLSLSFPHGSPTCESAAAHCKCASMQNLSVAEKDVSVSKREQSIYIGDGRSDVCAARKCNVVFAKQTLANVFAAERRPFVRYSTLSEITTILSDAWEPR